MNILGCILGQAEETPHSAAVVQLYRTEAGTFRETTLYTYQSLICEAQHLAAYLRHMSQKGAHVGVVMANSPEWVLADLALLLAELVEVPVPLAFSGDQAAFLLQSCDVVLTDAIGAERLDQWQQSGLLMSSRRFSVSRGHIPLHAHLGCPAEASMQEDAIIKVIHTSGTTSQPKGVLIRRYGLDALVGALWQRVKADDYLRYLNLVPLSLLVEQVTAIYMTLTSGGAIVMPPSEMPPLGSPGVTAAERLEIIRQARPSALTLTPALVEALAERANQYGNEPDLVPLLFGRKTVPLLAAGGGPVTPDVLFSLDKLGISVYQGYGLSENSSVVTWNSRSANRIGTVGQPLAHVEIKIFDDGELCLRSSSLFAGYSNEDPTSCPIDEEGWLHTGDVATQEKDGFITIIGRKKSMIITTNGRNVSPEWLEAAYRSVPGVVQAIVYGDKRQFLGGIFVVENMERAPAIRQAIAAYARDHLNEIEHIVEPLLFPQCSDIIEQLFTVTGRPRRNAITFFLERQGITKV